MDTYLDTSVVVAAITREPRTPDAQRLLAESGGALSISDWTVTEVASALAIKRRHGSLAGRDHALAGRTFARLSSEALSRLPVLSSDFTRAAALAGRSELTVRAGDALHLAVAERVGGALATFDVSMARAAALLGIAVVEVGGSAVGEGGAGED